MGVRRLPDKNIKVGQKFQRNTDKVYEVLFVSEKLIVVRHEGGEEFCHNLSDFYKNYKPYVEREYSFSVICLATGVVGMYLTYRDAKAEAYQAQTMNKEIVGILKRYIENGRIVKRTLIPIMPLET